MPENPPAWLLQVARRRALDVLRRDRSVTVDLDGLAGDAVSPDVELDDTLALMFMTCHPSLPPESRVALTLKVAGGFSVEEIARGLFADTRAVAQRLVRAKRQLRDEAFEVAVPAPAELPARLASVHDALALMFTSGYGAGEGDALIHEDVCVEAVRLVRLLVRHPRTATPESHALAALLLLQAARLPARQTDGGDLAILETQDRSRWLWPLVEEAHTHLDRAATGTTLSRWHLQAGIAALHAGSPSVTETRWDRIVTLYDDLVALQPHGVTRLNRAIAIGFRDGPRAALDALADAATDPRLTRFHLFHAARGQFLSDLGDAVAAREAYQRALACPCSTPEQRFLRAREAQTLS